MSEIIEREITQGLIPIGTPKAYQYDSALVESAKSTVFKGISDIETLGNAIVSQIENGYGYPFTANTPEAMTDHTKIYVYTGTTGDGFTNGNWYYWNGSVWTSGGIYNSTAFETDTTLSVSGEAPDSKVVGDTFDILFDRYTKYIVTDKYIYNGKWTSIDGATCCLYPIKAGQTYEIKGTQNTTQTMIAVLTGNDTTIGNDAPFSADSKWTSVVNGLSYVTIKGVFPSDAQFLYFYNGFTDGTSRTPSAIKIDGYDILSTIQGNAHTVSQETDAKNDFYNDMLKVAGVRFPNNIFNKNHIETNYVNGWLDHYTIDAITGELTSTTNPVAVTYLVPTLDKTQVSAYYGSAQLSVNFLRIASYDKNGNFIEISTSVNTYVLPKNAYYIRGVVSYEGASLASRHYNNFTISDSIVAGNPYELYSSPISPQLNLLQIFPKFTTIGDSLMGGFMNRDGVSVTTEEAKSLGNNWVNYLSLRIGRTFVNLAVGGSTAKQWRESLLTNANISTDCYLIGIGVNDKRQELTIGTSSDIATDFHNNADSFYGNYDYMVRQLMVWNPTSHIFVFTIPIVESGDIASYNSAIQYIASLYSEKVHCVDLYNDYKDAFENDIVISNFYGSHYNPITYNYFSSVIEKAINNYMFVNNQLFAVTPYA